MESGDTRELPTRSIVGQHSTLPKLIPLAREIAAEANVAVPWHVLEAAAERGPSPWADPIPSWAGDMSRDTSAGLFVTRGGVEELLLESEASGIAAGHIPDVVVAAIPIGAMLLSVLYEWDRGIPFAPPRPGALTSTDTQMLLPGLDARLYAGEKSAIFEIDALPVDANVPPEIVHDRQPTFRWLFGIARRAGIFVGRIVNRTMIRHAPPMAHDPGFQARLREQEDNVAPELASLRLHDVTPANGHMVIVVHGTFACSVEIAARLRETYPDVNVSRFEHDTFPSVTGNVDDLFIQLVRLADLGVPSFTLVGHSRGGLVACQAASLFSQLRREVNISVRTYGTPHYGTPLAGLGGIPAQSLGALYRLCARRRDGAFFATFAEGAASYLISTNQLPPGVAVMREGSDFLALHRSYAAHLQLLTFGGRCDSTGGSATGHGVLLHPAVDQLFSGRDHDLVVPTESAIIDGSAPIEDCNHFQYFDRLSGF